MKKKTIFITVAIILVLFAGLYYIFTSFNGSLIHKARVRDKVRDYLNEYYPKQGLDVAPTIYDFKNNQYFCHVQSIISEDTAFDVFEMKGGELRDDYQFSVVEKENTIRRLSMLLDQMVEEKIKVAYPYKTRLILCDFYYGIEFDRSKFKLDMSLELDNLPHPAALTLWVESTNTEPTWEEAADYLREAVRVTEAENLDISYFSISVEYPYNGEEGDYKPADYNSIVGINDVPKDVITGEGLEELLEEERIKREEELLMIQNGQNPPDKSVE